MSDNLEKLKGPIDFIHQNVDMTQYHVTLANNRSVRTCKPAMGYAFAAGTIDGPGLSWFHQHTNDSEPNPFWNFLRDFLKHPSEEMIGCQHPKEIILAVGEMNFPYQWVPFIIPTQIFKIGNVAIAGLPAEFTTMSGRRVREAIAKEFKDEGVHVTLAGLANTYTNYVTTFEEYQEQRYLNKCFKPF